MKENFLHFVWQYQYFNKSALKTESGETVEILTTGSYNTDGGPDFFNSRIKIGSVEWHGNVEIHLRSSDWIVHNHQTDKSYDNVILHVVWKNDKSIKRTDGSTIPAIELEDKVDQEIFSKYSTIFQSNKDISCQAYFHKVPDIIKVSMLEKALIQRLKKKGEEVIDRLNKNKGDWEETSYQLLCKNFGFKLNADPFLQLAQNLPYKLIQKHKHDLKSIESLLFGQAGMLEGNFKEAYFDELKSEYLFLSHKYNLSGSKLDPSQWKFLRLRPANFPTVRIAQLSAILKNATSLYSSLTEYVLDDLYKLLKVIPSEHWQKHYNFNSISSRDNNGLGSQSIENIIINTAIPLKVAKSKVYDREDILEETIALMEVLPAESNRITKDWIKQGFKIKAASDSQGSIELYNTFCKNNLCLSCNIGVSLIRQS